MRVLLSSTMFLFLGAIGCNSIAAEINFVEFTASDGTKIPFIDFTGDIVSEDLLRFQDVAKVAPSNTTVMFKSNGGALEAGINIGREIRKRHFSTAVFGTCASACALAWLGGGTLYGSKVAEIGFHAAFTGETVRKESGLANALVGLYLGELGYGENVVKYMTSAPPEGMAWLSARDAMLLGINVTILDLDDQPTASRQASPEPEIAAGNFPAAATDFAKHLLALHTTDNDAALAAVLANYAPEVDYFGKKVTLSEVYRDKMQYFLRWPIRRTWVMDGSLTASCNGAICLVRGVYQWAVSNPQRRKEISGTASFYYEMDMQKSIRVISEGGTVIKKNP